MKATESVVAWTPNTKTFSDSEVQGQLRLYDQDVVTAQYGPDFPRPYAKWQSVVGPKGRPGDTEWNTMLMFATFRNLIVEELIDPKLVDEVFWELEEYGKALTASRLTVE